MRIFRSYHGLPSGLVAVASAILGQLSSGQAQTAPPRDPVTFARPEPGALSRPVSDKLAEVLSLKDFTKGDGVTIDTAGFVNALNAARGTPNLTQASGVSIYVPPLMNGKCYQIDRTIVIEAWNGFDMYGAGWASCLQAVGSSMRSLILMKGSYSGHIRNLHLVAVPQHPIDTFIEMTQGNPAGPGHTSQANLLEDVWLDASRGGVTDSVVVDGEDANNDFHTFVRVLVQGFTDAAFKLVGSQSYSHRFQDCRISGYYTANGTSHWGKYGVKAISSSADSGKGSGGAASFSWSGGSVGTSEYDFYINGYSDFPYDISGFDDESAGGELLYAVGTPSFVVLRNGRFARTNADSQTDFIHADGISLAVSDLTANSFRAGGDPADMTIYYKTSGNPNGQPELTIADSQVVTTRKTPSTFFTSGQNPITFLTYSNFSILSPHATSNTFFGGVRSYSPEIQTEKLNANSVAIAPRRVSELGAASPGAIAYVTDSSTNVIGSRVAGAGKYAVMVASPDGQNWYVVAAPPADTK